MYACTKSSYIYTHQFYTLQNTFKLKESLLSPTIVPNRAFLQWTTQMSRIFPHPNHLLSLRKNNYILSPSVPVTQTNPCFTCSLRATDLQHHTLKNTFRYFIYPKNSCASTCRLPCLRESLSSVLRLRWRWWLFIWMKGGLISPPHGLAPHCAPHTVQEKSYWGCWVPNSSVRLRALPSSKESRRISEAQSYDICVCC